MRKAFGLQLQTLSGGHVLQSLEPKLKPHTGNLVNTANAILNPKNYTFFYENTEHTLFTKDCQPANVMVIDCSAL